MNVFVLGTGRCGSVTFSRACGHLSNYSCGHETLAKYSGPSRFAYPGRHIEVDNRLSWFLGQLAARFEGKEVFYVHLRRDPTAVARSYLRRWDSDPTFRASIIRAFGHGLLKHTDDWLGEERMEVCRMYVNTVTSNVDDFLRGRPSMTMWLEEVDDTFPVFLERINAEGDLEQARAEWRVAHNAANSKVSRRPIDNRTVGRTPSSELVRVLAQRMSQRLVGVLRSTH